MPGLSRTRAAALIRAGHVSMSHIRSGAAAVRDADLRVKAGQSFAIFVPESEPAAPRAEAIALTILHEDDDLVVIDKPAGLVVHPAPGHWEGTLVNALLAHCGDTLTGIGGVRRPGIVHRLDKDTSGVMVAAKTEAAYAALQAQFARHDIERRYVALVWGVPSPRAGTIEGAIGRSRQNRKKMAVVARGGKPALTRYRVERTFGDGLASLLALELATGRTHQIRVHLASRGHAVLGDPVYGGSQGRVRRLPVAAREALKRLGRQALHAQILGFRHPRHGRPVRFYSTISQDMKVLILSLE
ncbi:MAG: RluA family pseudouridine synthase [Alphaproteobacteria bacterium]|nr:RluA family pseudouridine synthase [Alphaproteobacteria bacterium]